MCVPLVDNSDVTVAQYIHVVLDFKSRRYLDKCYLTFLHDKKDTACSKDWRYLHQAIHRETLPQKVLKNENKNTSENRLALYHSR